MTARPLTHPPVPPPSAPVVRLLRNYVEVKLHPDGMAFRLSTPPHLAPQTAEAMCWISGVTGMPIDRRPPTAADRMVLEDDDGWISLAELLDRWRIDHPRPRRLPPVP